MHLVTFYGIDGVSGIWDVSAAATFPDVEQEVRRASHGVWHCACDGLQVEGISHFHRGHGVVDSEHYSRRSYSEMPNTW